MVRSKRARMAQEPNENHTKHIENAIKKRNFNDRISITITADFVKYPELQVTAQYLNSLFARFKPTTSQALQLGDRSSLDSAVRQQLENKLKHIRKQIAPQLLLSLHHAGIMWSSMNAEEKKAATWVKLVKSELDQYYYYEPVLSLYSKWEARKNFYGPESTEALHQACQERFKLRFLGVAIEHCEVKIGEIEKVVKHLNMTFSGSEKQQRQIAQKVAKQALEKLGRGRTEWQMIDRYWKTYSVKFADRKESLDCIVTEAQLSRHLAEVESAIREVREIIVMYE